MCGRITQQMTVTYYSNILGMRIKDVDEPLYRDPIGNYNAGPGARQWVLRRDEDANVLPEQLAWQWLSPWAKEKKMKPAINAKLEKLLGAYYRGLMKSGRIVVPADGWFEWTAEDGGKQPWYIKPKDGQPLFLAGLTDLRPGVEGDAGSGFVIVTNESAGGMVDIHDRRPVALLPEDARDWLDLGFDYKQAEMIARERSLPVDVFEWYRVSRDVNGSRMRDAHLIEPIG
ncbi:SOS response-associated peptidase [Undibacterium sp.]|jgi:putative SOS response-associated peptidase YedK|uniref:SOS response-associated peptidase n=1 Tax=Undibacterium sp. TaxID=1914977 RepID=UPI002CC2D650|nr:SOS response-associated peptidase [Undibacterium sp.]HTD05664.1 SOS response-associated peptidase [Undibacterium sp.]